MAEKTFTVSQAARKLGVAMSYVYALLWAGKLEANKVNRQWRIAGEALEARLKRRAE